MAKAPKSNPKPAAQASKGSAKPLPKKGSPPAKAKGDSVDVKAMEEAVGLTKPAKRVKPLTEVYTEETAAKPAVPARLVALSLLRPSPTNPRKHLGDLTELAASLASIGQLQPLVVRPHPQEGGALEVVCGHRRFAAAALAKLDELLVVERSLSDREVLEAQLTENGQRADVHPLEEASALHRLHREHRVEVAELAARLGRSPSYVHQRLRLMHLASTVAEAFEANRLSLAVALRLARLPEKAQKAVLPQLVVDEGEAPKPLNGVRWVLDRCHLRLVDSPFALDDDSLPGGCCLTCPKRTGNQLVIFEAEPDDLCTDPDCHKAKAEETKARKIAAAKEKGIEVLPAAKAPFDWGGRVHYDAEFIDLDAPVPEPEEDADESDDQAEGEEQDETPDLEEKPEPPRRTWRDVLGDKVKVVLAEDKNGKLHELVHHDEVRDALPPNAPAELHEAVAPREKEERESDWKKKHAEAAARREAHEARVKALAARLPVLDPRAFRAAVVGMLDVNAWPFEDALKALGAWKEGESGHHDKEATSAAVRALPLEALWRLWLADALSDDDIDLDELEAPEAPAEAQPPHYDPVAELAARREQIRAWLLDELNEAGNVALSAERLREMLALAVVWEREPALEEVTTALADLIKADLVHKTKQTGLYAAVRKAAPAMQPVAPAPAPLEEPAPRPSPVDVPEPQGGWREARKKVVDIIARAKGEAVYVSSIASIKGLPRTAVQAVVALLDASDAVAVETGTDGISKVEPSVHIDLVRISEGLWRMTHDYVAGLVEDAAEPPTEAKLAADLELPEGLVVDVLNELMGKRRLSLHLVDGLAGARWTVASAEWAAGAKAAKAKAGAT
jgi:ParB/RepB/Spo0J family partition protein